LSQFFATTPVVSKNASLFEVVKSDLVSILSTFYVWFFLYKCPFWQLFLYTFQLWRQNFVQKTRARVNVDEIGLKIIIVQTKSLATLWLGKQNVSNFFQCRQFILSIYLHQNIVFLMLANLSGKLDKDY